MKILLLGAGGQVGFELMRALGPLGALNAATRDGMLPGGARCRVADLGADPAALRALLDEAAPDVIVNAAAYTAVDRAEDEPALAQAINAGAPETLGRWAAAHGAAVIHYSTDYVFDGGGPRPWREDDTPAPRGVYGASKLAGEQALRASGAPHLILRTAWVYAARGHNFLRTMLRLAGERESLRVVNDQFGTPTPARLIANATAAMLARMAPRGDFTGDAAWGTYHLTASGHASWHGFAEALLQAAQRAGLIARMPELLAISSADYPTRAQRPAWSVLDCTRVQDVFALRLPDWQTALDAVIGELAGCGAQR
ncbi:MAG: dTDP-4-dehydrorhamnose reductase [Metallibacterium scheffleri]|jgi:dTDP-4-dehydrorhamnose reductase|uniref:dTDP-4-dehydrorhamnose reductase n=1 Tax=Metallibacterium scheffleri TaxID=993689 RepID=UPI0026EE0197|nr:dTDP-4-dehydrorhamnose reductase [Metallibacterium scheffleri]MCK9366210.1 dTDP-4-dehydrorhamnose reductase [Metallibacterium scheffleri]